MRFERERRLPDARGSGSRDSVRWCSVTSTCGARLLEMRQASAGHGAVAARARPATRRARSPRPQRSSSWLLDLHFVFLGYREYQLPSCRRSPRAGPSSPRPAAAWASSTPTGPPTHTAVALADSTPSLRERFEEGDLADRMSKTNRLSTSTGVRGWTTSACAVSRPGRQHGRRGAHPRAVHLEGLHRRPPRGRRCCSASCDQSWRAADLFEGSHDYKAVVRSSRASRRTSCSAPRRRRSADAGRGAARAPGAAAR